MTTLPLGATLRLLTLLIIVALGNCKEEEEEDHELRLLRGQVEQARARIVTLESQLRRSTGLGRGGGTQPPGNMIQEAVSLGATRQTQRGAKWVIGIELGAGVGRRRRRRQRKKRPRKKGTKRGKKHEALTPEERKARGATCDAIVQWLWRRVASSSRIQGKAVERQGNGWAHTA